MIEAKLLFSCKSDELGLKQRKSIDFGETFAPTVLSSCVRLLSAIAYELDRDVRHFDVDQAFVQSKLDEDVCLCLPKGCGSLSGRIVRLNKSLYGLSRLPGHGLHISHHA